MARIFLVIYVLIVALNLAFKPVPPEEPCLFWVSPVGNDGNAGTPEEPWATLGHAAALVPDERCTVWFQDGVYTGDNRIKRSFETFTRFKAVNPYRVIFQDDGPVLSISGGRHMSLEGFIFQHSGPGSTPLVVQVYRNEEIWSEYIFFRNNIFRNSYNSDLLKIYNGARFITVSNNLFYNQGASDQQIDVNSVSDVTIQDNVFFNDFAGSGRSLENNSKHYIVIKDSNEGDDGMLGAKRITVERNIFLNWQGNPGETFVQIGNDGKPYFEASQVSIRNNLFLGNSPNPIGAAFGVSGAKDVLFINNTVSGDLPSLAYAARIDIKAENPKNETIILCNNIWSDPTGTMGMGTPEEANRNEFADGDPGNTVNLVLDHNLYWNGPDVIPDGDLLSPMADDAHLLIANPELNTRFRDMILPAWEGTRFSSGNVVIREEFLRLAATYGTPSTESPARLKGNPDCASRYDIFRFDRGQFPSLGAAQGPVRLFSILSPFRSNSQNGYLGMDPTH